MKEKKIPVFIGEELTIRPSGMGKQDPYYNFDGFIIFIKECPADALVKFINVRIRITAIKGTFAFAEYLEDE
jgi:predicted RNA-binding protein with TRAM domain